MKLIGTSTAWLCAGVLIVFVAATMLAVGIVGAPLILAHRAYRRSRSWLTPKR